MRFLTIIQQAHNGSNLLLGASGSVAYIMLQNLDSLATGGTIPEVRHWNKSFIREYN